ncbi:MULTISPECIES: LysR family transcriptional regulator [unclassified Roseitalea]|uniref:LysR family transcriptional regulator n=1 Tax=unclassified Roseitalea TaxID=2639107 RepID=UPI00273EB009|nr:MULTISPECIES: LysR family transcriptional regulator [unclassified Roseitalea]
MSDLNETKIRRLDFMLLLVLREGVRRRKLSDVAAALGVTQTAISHSVARLRDVFDDELFIRRPHGVEPTTRAIQLARIAEQVIEAAETMLANPAPFNPATEHRELRICALDFEVTLLSGVIERLHQEAPGLRFLFKGMGRDAAVAALERDEADLWIGFARQLPGSLQTRHLVDETYKVIARSDHPRIAAGGPVTLNTYCAEHHVVAAPGGTTGGIVDSALRARGRTRTVAVTTTGFLTALDLVSRTELIATVPASLAMAHATNFRLLVVDPPVTPRPFNVSAVWHKRASGDAVIAWVVARMCEATM